MSSFVNFRFLPRPRGRPQADKSEPFGLPHIFGLTGRDMPVVKSLTVGTGTGAGTGDPGRGGGESQRSPKGEGETCKMKQGS